VEHVIQGTRGFLVSSASARWQVRRGQFRTDRHCVWSADERQSRWQSIARICCRSVVGGNHPVGEEKLACLLASLCTGE